MLEGLRTSGELVSLGPGTARADKLLHTSVIRQIEDRVLDVLTQLHQLSPLLPAIDRQKLQAQVAKAGNEALVNFTVDRLMQAGRVVGDRNRIARSDFKAKLGSNWIKLKDEIVTAYRNAGLRPPRPADFMGRATGKAGDLEDLFTACIAEGHLIHIQEEVYLHREAEAHMRELIAARLSSSTGMFLSELREILQSGRRLAVIYCEYLDRLGITRRDGDLRTLASVQSPACEPTSQKLKLERNKAGILGLTRIVGSARAQDQRLLLAPVCASEGDGLVAMLVGGAAGAEGAVKPSTQG